MSKSRLVTRRQALASTGALLALTLGACSGSPETPAEETIPTVTDPEASGGATDPTPQDGLEAQVSAKLSEMTLEQKVAQLFIVRPESLTGVGQVIAAGDATKAALEKMPVGGVVYFADNLALPVR